MRSKSIIQNTGTIFVHVPATCTCAYQRLAGNISAGICTCTTAFDWKHLVSTAVSCCHPINKLTDWKAKFTIQFLEFVTIELTRTCVAT